MASTTTDRINGVNTSLAIKAPCRCATTANITLAGFQTIDGVTPADGDTNLRILVKNQTTASQNGIYDMSSGTWSRSADCDGAGDLVKGTRIPVVAGTVNAGLEYTVTASDPITIGTTSITVSESISAQAAAAIAAAAAAAVSESNAATSETNAATSESNAATSESNAATSETNAATSESNAATSAASAATSVIAVSDLTGSSTVIIGPTTPATGSVAPVGTYFLDRAMFDGYVESLKIWARGDGTVYLRRFTRSGSTMTFVQEVSVVVDGTPAALNTFTVTGTTLDTLPVSAGDYLAIYIPASTVDYIGSVSPSNTEYWYDAGNITTTANTGSMTVSTTGNQLQVRIDIVEQFAAGAVVTDAVESAIGETVYHGLYEAPEAVDGAATYMEPSTAVFDAHPAQNNGVLETVEIYAAVIGQIDIYVLREMAGGYTLRHRIPLKANSAAAVNTFTAGVDFPYDLNIGKGDLLGAWVRPAACVPFNSVKGTKYVRTATGGLPLAAGTLYSNLLAASNTSIPQIRYAIKCPTTQKSITERLPSQLNSATYGTVLPLRHKSGGTWTHGSGVATNSTSGITTYIESDTTAGGQWHKSIHRVTFTLDSGSPEFAIYRRPLVSSAGTIGSITTDASNNMRLYGLWGGGALPSVSTQKTCSFSIVTGRKYRLELEKDYYTITLRLYDTITGNSDTLVSNVFTDGYDEGFCCGLPGFSPLVGVSSVYSDAYLTPGIKDPSVIIYGDSITDGSGGSTATNGYAYQLAQAIGTDKVLISSLTGQTSSNVAARIEQELWQFAAPKYVVVFIGTNDTSSATYQTNMGNILCAIRRCNAIPVLVVPPPDAVNSPQTNGINAYLTGLTEILVRADRATSTNGDGTTRNGSLAADTQHPNDAGHTAIYNRFRLDVPELFE